MDGFLRSDNSLSNLYEVCHNVTTVLQKCSFRLRKWITNDQKLLESFEPSERLLKKRLSDLDEKESNHNTLGLIWNVKSDVLKLCFIEKFYKETKTLVRTIIPSVFTVFQIFKVLKNLLDSYSYIFATNFNVFTQTPTPTPS